MRACRRHAMGLLKGMSQAFFIRLKIKIAVLPWPAMACAAVLSLSYCNIGLAMSLGYFFSIHRAYEQLPIITDFVKNSQMILLLISFALPIAAIYTPTKNRGTIQQEIKFLVNLLILMNARGVADQTPSNGSPKANRTSKAAQLISRIASPMRPTGGKNGTNNK